MCVGKLPESRTSWISFAKLEALAGCRAILKKLSRATVYAHTTGSVAGGPLDFIKPKTGCEQGEEVESIFSEGVGFTRSTCTSRPQSRSKLRSLPLRGTKGFDLRNFYAFILPYACTPLPALTRSWTFLSSPSSCSKTERMFLFKMTLLR